MRIEKGNLWDWWAKGWKIVISTNIGWSDSGETDWAAQTSAPKRRKFCNNMGAGIALEAWRRWPWLAEWLGSHYRARSMQGAEQRPVEHDQLRLIFVPVKPLNVDDPAYSWNQPADIRLISFQLGMLSAHRGDIALGFVGCGNGNADPKAVLPSLLKLEIVRIYSGQGKTVVVDRRVP
jgi:hypothetical protein